MLENNHLYRRIEHKNLFHTFSRTYSRHAPLRNPQSQNIHKTITLPHNNSSTPLIPAHPSALTSNTQFVTLNSTTQRHEPRGSTAPIFKRSTGQTPSETLFTSTLNLTKNENILDKGERYSSNPYLNSLIEKKRQRGSMLSNIKFANKKENFKLKECIQRDINYETDLDQTDFSILQHNKQNQIRKKGAQIEAKSNASTQIGFFQAQGHGGGLGREVRMQVGRRIAAHLFNKYTRGMEEVRGKKLSINNSLQRYV